MTEPSELERGLAALDALNDEGATDLALQQQAARLLRELARDFARWTADPIPCLGASQRKKLDTARARWRLSE